MAGEFTYPQIDIPHVNSLAEVLSQWNGIKQQKLQLAAMQSQEDDRAKEQDRNDQVRAMFANGQEPTHQQLMALDPNYAMKMQGQQDAHNTVQQAYDTKQLTGMQSIASGLVNKFKQSGLDPNSPQGQQYLDQIATPYVPIIEQMAGHKGAGGPISWNSLEALSQSVPREYHPPVPTTSGYLQFDNGQFSPMVGAGGKTYMPANADPFNAEQMQAARERMKGVKITDQNNSEYYAPQGQVNPAFGASAQQQFQQVPNQVQQASPQAQPQPSAFNFSKASEMQAFLNSPEGQSVLAGETGLGQPQHAPMQQPQPGIVKSPTMEQKANVDINKAAQLKQMDSAADVQKAADLAKNEKDRSFKEISMYLDTPIEGKSIEQLINESTGSLAGEMRDKIGNAVGHSSKGALASTALSTVAGWLTGSVPRFPGNQSDADRNFYEKMAGRIADTSLPSDQRINSFNALKAMIKERERVESQAQPKTKEQLILEKYGVR